MTNPPCTTVPMLENSSPHMDAAKISPAAVITPPVELRVRTMPNRPSGASSRIRDTSSRL